MTEINNKLLTNFIPQSSNLDSKRNSNSFISITSPQTIDYYQSPTNLGYNEEHFEYSSNYNNFQSNLNNNFIQNNMCQTPVMNYFSNNIQEETQNSQLNHKYEPISTNTNDSSKNMQIEIVPTIENIVSTANLCCEIKLREIALQAKNAEYNPKRFSAVIMKIKEPKTTALIFSSGRMVCLGAKNEEDSKKACKKFAKIIKSLGYPVVFKEFKIQNVVGSVDSGYNISLMKLYIHLIKRINCKGNNFVAFEPEQFPGLIYRMIEPNIAILIFFSGKLVLTGGKQKEDIYQGFKKIYPLLVKFKNEEEIKNSKKMHQNNVEKMKEIKNEKIID